MKPFRQFVGILLALPDPGRSQSQCFKEFLIWESRPITGRISRRLCQFRPSPVAINWRRIRCARWMTGLIKSTKAMRTFMTKPVRMRKMHRTGPECKLDEAPEGQDEAQLQAQISEANRLAFIASQEVEKEMETTRWCWLTGPWIWPGIRRHPSSWLW